MCARLIFITASVPIVRTGGGRTALLSHHIIVEKKQTNISLIQYVHIISVRDYFFKNERICVHVPNGCFATWQVCEIVLLTMPFFKTCSKLN